MRNTNETTYNQDAANNAALIYIALLGAFTGVAVLLICFCLFRYNSKQSESVAENQNRIASSNAIRIQIDEQLPSDNRPRP